MEPLIPRPTLAERNELLAVAKPALVRRNLWFFGVLGLWSTIGLVASLAATSWVLAVLMLAAASLSVGGWWIRRRAIRNAPATQRWIDELQHARGSKES